VAANLTEAWDYESALRALFALGQGRSLPGRERLRGALALAGDPHLAAPAVLIAGTNGKGRVTAALSAALSRRYRAGAFIKPHLKSVRERWRVNDSDLSEAQFTAACVEALEVIERHTLQSGEAISFFEANVLTGALAFRAARCEIVVWEVGLGGLHDACNLCEPFLSLLTNVQLDHTAILGGTLEEIARDKAHIARRGRPLLLGPPREGWEEGYARYAPVVREVCAEIGAKLEEVPLPPAQASLPVIQETQAQGLALPSDTAALLSAALPHLAAAGFPLDAAEVSDGLATLHYRGRFERTLLAGHPVILDAAHNPDSMRWLGLELARIGGPGARYPFVFGCQITRDPAEMLCNIAPVAASITPIAVPVLRPCPPARIAEAAGSLGIPLSLPPGRRPAAELPDYSIGHATELDPPDDSTGWMECVRHALALGAADLPTVICGSIYVLGEVLRAFEDDRRSPAR
jgi:dihydrofolate synthase / folylpolyglutamate synthase